MRQDQDLQGGLTERDRIKELAFHNAMQFLELKDGLIATRIEQGQTQKEVGMLLGKGQSAIAHFEDEGNDPRLSTLASYALAVGARVTVKIERNPSAERRQFEKIGARTQAHGNWERHVIRPLSRTDASATERERTAFVLAA